MALYPKEWRSESRAGLIVFCIETDMLKLIVIIVHLFVVNVQKQMTSLCEMISLLLLKFFKANINTITILQKSEY